MGNFFKSKVFKSGLLLTSFGFLGKVVGAIFKIGLSVLVGSLGMGIYQLMFPLLVFFTVLSSGGFSLALTIKTAENKTKSKHGGYFKLSIASCFILSLISSILIVLFAKRLSKLQGSEISPNLYYIVAVGVVVISTLSIIKAKIQGEERFKLYSLAEIIEDIFRVVIGLILGYLLLGFGADAAICGVFVGIILSSLLSIIFLLIFRGNKGQVVSIPLSRFERKEFFKYSLLALASALVVPIIQFIESAVVINLLTATSNISNMAATKLYGLSRGSVSAIINIPFFVLSSFEILLLPNLARSKNCGNYYKKTEVGLFLALAISIPFVLLFELYAPVVINFLYGNALSAAELSVSANLLQIGSVGIVFSAISIILSVILNSNNIVKGPFIASIVAGAMKLVFIFVFVSKMSIYAVELSSVIFSMTMCLVNLIFAVKYKCFSSPKKVGGLTLIWSVLFALTWCIYKLFLNVVDSMFWACVIAFSVVAVVIVLSCTILYFINKEKVVKMFKQILASE